MPKRKQVLPLVAAAPDSSPRLVVHLVVPMPRQARSKRLTLPGSRRSFTSLHRGLRRRLKITSKNRGSSCSRDRPAVRQRRFGPPPPFQKAQPRGRPAHQTP
jgi:hypothetical protein